MRNTIYSCVRLPCSVRTHTLPYPINAAVLLAIIHVLPFVNRGDSLRYVDRVSSLQAVIMTYRVRWRLLDVLVVEIFIIYLDLEQVVPQLLVVVRIAEIPRDLSGQLLSYDFLEPSVSSNERTDELVPTFKYLTPGRLQEETI